MKPDILKDEEELTSSCRCGCGPSKNETPEEKKKGDKKINTLIYCLIGALLLFAVGVYLNDTTGLIFKKDVNFYQYSNGDTKFDVMRSTFQGYPGWDIKFFFPESDKPYMIDFRHDPLSLEDITIDRRSRDLIGDDRHVFLTWDPGQGYGVDVTFAGLDLIKVIANQNLYNLPVNTSFTSEHNNHSVMTCDGATKESTVIYLKLGDETEVTTDGNCIIVQGETEEDILRAADRLSLLLIGIMK